MAQYRLHCYGRMIGYSVSGVSLLTLGLWDIHDGQYGIAAVLLLAALASAGFAAGWRHRALAARGGD